MTTELYKVYRPKKLSDVLGQDAARKSLLTMIKNNKIPHSLLFSGPSGCGKTTIARILAGKVQCGKHDLTEKNCADFRGIEMVRDIRSKMNLKPVDGKTRVWIIDECHKLSSDAMNAFLKILEDTPNHVYFFLATTDPQKLLKTIRTRCTEIAVKSLSVIAMEQLISQTADSEQMKIPKAVVSKIIENSEGSARKALVLLHQVIGLENEKDMLETIQQSSVETQVFEIVKALGNKNTKWETMKKILNEVDINDAEGIRWLVLSCAKQAMLSNKGNVGRGYLIIDAFRDNFYDSKAAGLVAACYEVIHGE
jgi:DNA polymerase-3 subunit gamma/tau